LNSPLVVQELQIGGTDGAYGKQARRLFYDKIGGETARRHRALPRLAKEE
jgi:hypothetical protein